MSASLPDRKTDMKLAALITAISAALLLTCTGTGSEVEGKRFAIEGKAIYADDGPVAGAKVRIRPNGFLALYADKFPAFDTVTDERGFFYFDTIPADSYTIEINKDGELGALQALNVGANDSFPIVLPTATLTPTGAICGRINLPISDDTARPWVALYNVDYIAEMPLTQDFLFTGVPEGVYRLQIVPNRESKLIVELHDIHVPGDSVVDVGTLNFMILQFFRGCTSFECDSIAVRSILDANGLTDVLLETVATIDTAAGRIISLDLSHQSIASVTKEIGSLSRLLTLDLRGNRIQTLPGQIGYLSELRECRLDSNELYELPPEFAYCCSLKVLTAADNNLVRLDTRLARLPVTRLDLRSNILRKLPDANLLFPGIRFLYLDDNGLQSLPDALINLHPEEFSIGNNRLCAVPTALSSWLALQDKDWAASQDCSGAASPE